jgi:hypothetical protein
LYLLCSAAQALLNVMADVYAEMQNKSCALKINEDSKVKSTLLK